MSVYKVQVESQARPVCARFQENTPPRTPCIIKVDGVECVGQVLGPRPSACPAGHLSPLVRIASSEDLEKRERHRKLEVEALACFREQVRLLKLTMHPVSVQVALDESKFFFVYTAENKVDFRELVRVLAHLYHARIEMRQIGVRDESRLLGGYGHCGQPLCCTRYLRSFQPVTVRMAKDQGLSLNPAKISGHCGRLMCCLRYEAPAKGAKELAKGLEAPPKIPETPAVGAEAPAKGPEETARVSEMPSQSLEVADKVSAVPAQGPEETAKGVEEKATAPPAGE